MSDQPGALRTSISGKPEARNASLRNAYAIVADAVRKEA